MTAPAERVDYDRIATRYDAHRGWDASIPLRALELATGAPLRGIEPAGAILEVGCGTGNMTRWLLGSWPGPVVALDLSRGMLAQARAKFGDARFVRAPADRMPFRARAFEAALGSFFLHHLDGAARMRFFQELRRVLGAARGRRRCGGAAFVTSSHAQIRASYLTRWFPSVAELDCARFPDLDVLREELAEAGFSEIAATEVSRAVPRGGAEYIEKVRGRFISTLELVPEAEWHAGLQAMEAQFAAEGHLGDVSWYATVVHARCEP
ncbi:MAG: class I SAM-dependent methyltransferase [Planctomycetes bacterium]|nr:class I SAM-dependent methyltransferase [Planctomycetota bacterium]